MDKREIIELIESNFREVISKTKGDKQYKELRISKIKWEELKKEL